MAKGILFISPAGKGGGFSASLKLLEYISRETSVLIRGLILGSKSRKLATDERFNWHTIPWLGEYNRIVGTLERHLLLAFLYTFPVLFLVSFLATLKFRKEIRVLYGNGPISGMAAAIVSKVFKKMSVVHVHTDLKLSRKNGVMRWLIRRGFGLIDQILANSRDVAIDLMALGLPEGKITIVTNWVDLEKFSPKDMALARKSLGFDDKKLLLLYVGRFVDYKGVKVVIEAARELDDRDIEFIFIGEGSLEPVIRRLACQKENTNLIGFVGDDAQLALYYNASDALVWGAIDIYYLGLVTMEALACGLPVVTSNKATNVEPKEEKVDPHTLPKEVGFLIEPDHDGLKKMLVYLKANRELLMSMRPRCREFAERNFSKRNAAEVYYKVFEPFIASVVKEG